MNIQEQHLTTSTTASKGAPLNLSQEATTTTFSWTEGKPRVSYSAGKTISLGDFQFARVGVTVETEHGPNDESMTSALDKTRLIAKEIVDQEAASVKGEDREAGVYDPTGFSKYRVTIEYGLTLKTGKFDSAKVDISMTRYTDDASFHGAVGAMRQQLAERVTVEAKAIKE